MFGFLLYRDFKHHFLCETFLSKVLSDPVYYSPPPPYYCHIQTHIHTYIVTFKIILFSLFIGYCLPPPPPHLPQPPPQVDGKLHEIIDLICLIHCLYSPVSRMGSHTLVMDKYPLNKCINLTSTKTIDYGHQ